MNYLLLLLGSIFKCPKIMKEIGRQNQEDQQQACSDYSPRPGDRVALGRCFDIRRVSENNTGRLPTPLTSDALLFAAAVSALWLLPRIVSRAGLATKLVGFTLGLIAILALLAVVAGVISSLLGLSVSGFSQPPLVTYSASSLEARLVSSQTAFLTRGWCFVHYGRLTF